MKKYSILLLTIILFSCSTGLKKEGNMYVGKMSLKNGESIEKVISYKVDPYVLDTLKIDKTKIEELFKDAAIEAKASLKNPLSFDFLSVTENTGFMYSIPSDSTIKVSVEYIGQNGFGVKGKNTAIIKYDKKTLQLKDKMFM